MPRGASLTWTRDGRAVAVESGIGPVIFYDAATWTQTRSVGVPGAGSRGPVDVYAAGDDILAIAETTREAILVDPKTAHIVRRITLPVAADSRVAVSHDGHTLAGQRQQRSGVFEDLRTGQVRSGTGEHAGGAANMVLSPNGQTAASLHPDGAVTIWDARTGQPRLTLAGHSGPVTDGAFTPDGRTLYTASLDTSCFRLGHHREPVLRGHPAQHRARPRQRRESGRALRRVVSQPPPGCDRLPDRPDRDHRRGNGHADHTGQAGESP